jgi:hypothetical protein
MSYIKPTLEKQSFINLIKNGNFASWSQGDNAAPDGWAVMHATVQKNDDGSLGHPYVTLITDASGDGANIKQTNLDIPFFENLLQIAKAQKLTITAVAKVRTTSDKVNLTLYGVGVSTHTQGTGDWETLITQYQYNGSESYLGVVIGVDGVNNTTNITFDVGEVALYIGELPLPYQENPLDRALQAVHYQDSDGNNYEYRGLRCECGIHLCRFLSQNITEFTVTFQKPFRKILIAMACNDFNGTNNETIMSSQSTMTTSSATFKMQQRNNATISTTRLVRWLAIGVD